MKLLIAMALLAAAALWSCAPRALKEMPATPTSSDQDIDEIHWEQFGPPLPPEYNHSFNVILSRRQQSISIDSLRSAGIEVVRKLETRDFDRILALKSQYQIGFGPPLSFDGCIGGSGSRLAFFKEGTELGKGKLIDCGGQQRTNIDGNLFAFFDAIRRLAFEE